MQITVKLFASLGRYLPAGAKDNAALVDVPAGATPLGVLEQLGVPAVQCHLLLVNGAFVAPADRARVQLSEQDVLAAWPPVAGG